MPGSPKRLSNLALCCSGKAKSGWQQLLYILTLRYPIIRSRLRRSDVGQQAPCLHAACPVVKSSLFQTFFANHFTGVRLISTKGKVNDCKRYVKASADIHQRQQHARLSGPASSWQGMFYVALWTQTMQMYSKDVLEANWLELNLPRCSWVCLLEPLAWKLAGTDESNQSWL